ncbi:ABC transporter permease [Bacillaceae bacterium SAOS 7]|nr:ABC transporter permease [Bacillaceae bacterium SAOS 7]
MLFHLVKKDILIIKKFVLIMLMVAAIIPLFIMWKIPEMSGAIVFLFVVVFTELILIQYISQKEQQYPKASALLCSTPYPRKKLVQAKYVFFLLIFAYCYIIYSLEAFLILHIDYLNLNEILGVFNFIALCFSIYMPIQYKFGFEKTKFIFLLTLMITPFMLPSIINKLSANEISFWTTIPLSVQVSLLLILGMMVLFISMQASIKIYENQDLI